VQYVTWTTAGAVGNVNIDITTNGTGWTTVVGNTACDGSQNITVPNTPSTTCKMRVQESDGNPTDSSDSNFTIVQATQPPAANPQIYVSLDFRRGEFS